ncbi:MAG: hypothetical protein ACRD12_08435, partial [Acidimicrobiales bacterium]
KQHGGGAAELTVGSATPGAPSGSTGLDRANETPAAGHAPTSVPSPTSVPPVGGNGSNAGSTGLDRANQTPAAGHAPTAPGRP